MLISFVLFALSMSPPQAAQPAQPAAPPPKPYDCSAPEYRQFDFWVGEWDVVTNPAVPRPAGSPPPNPNRKPARNVISKIESGCVILEQWNDGVGGTGQSFNIYDRVKQRWHQTWVDNGGGLHEYWGGIVDGKMVYIGEVPMGPGQPFAGRRTIRVTFEPKGPDGMRQSSEALRSDGTWQPGYDFIYTRRAK